MMPVAIYFGQKGQGGSDDEGYGIAVDAAGNSYLTGYFKSDTATFGSTTLMSAGGYDIFVAKLGDVPIATSITWHGTAWSNGIPTIFPNPSNGAFSVQGKGIQ